MIASAAAAGVKRSRDTSFIHADALPLPEQFANLYMQLSHGTIEAGPTGDQGRGLGIIRTTSICGKDINTQMSSVIERRAKGTRSMGVISCRRREASLIPKLYTN